MRYNYFKLFFFSFLFSSIFILIFIKIYQKDNYYNISTTPIYFNGRIKPLSILAKDLFFDIKNNKHEVNLLCDLFFDFKSFSNYKIFILEKNTAKNLNLNENISYYSLNEMLVSLKKNYQLIESLYKIDYDNRTVEQNKLLEIYYLTNKLLSLKDYFVHFSSNVYNFQNLNYFYFVYFDNKWESNDFFINTKFSFSLDYKIIKDIVKNYSDLNKWSNSCYNYKKLIYLKLNFFERVKFNIESFYTKFNFILFSFLMYLISIIAIYFESKNKSLCFLFFVFCGLLFHFSEIFIRVLLTERPPVTNLYESIVFVNIIVVGVFLYLFLKFFINRFFILGVCALQYIAYRYSLNVDNITNLVPVLNTNFWLSVHVITITLGYVFCLIAGFLSHLYLYYRFKSVSNFVFINLYFNLIYIFTILALIFSFCGTILGGIWADQSWGRFWGWDPKENGAMLVVLWLVLISHFKFLNYFKSLYFVFGVIFNNFVVLVAWFGVNLLNIGLHSYGFIKSIGYGLILCLIFEISYILYFFLIYRKFKKGV